MNALCDVNVSLRTARWLTAHGVAAEHVNQVFGTSDESDQSIIAYADERDMVVISHDADFSIGYFTQRRPRRLISLATGNIVDSQLIYLFEQNLQGFLAIYRAHPTFLIQVNSLHDWVYFCDQV